MLNNLYSDEIQHPFNYNNLGQPPVISSIKRSQFETQAQLDFQQKLLKARSHLPQDADSEISSRVAAVWPDGHLGLDTRPRLVDGITGSHCLVDSGSAITAIAAGPNDVPDPQLSLRSANGSIIECCGYKEVKFRIGRKTYSIRAAIAKIEDTILGWDFIIKNKHNFIWEGDECFIYDRKAKIKKLLEFIKIPHQSKPRFDSIQYNAAYLEEAEMLYSMATMTACDAGSDSSPSEKTEILQSIKTLGQISSTSSN